MPETKPKKIRNYSFKNSKRLPESRMTEINNIKIPSMPGSCYHAIICALASHKDAFCNWDKVYELTEKYMRQYGGSQSWDKFTSKTNVKPHKQRVKDNTHTLTRTGKDCYGYRLHERGMAIYFFKDGAMLLSGGRIVEEGDSYEVLFPDGKSLQARYRGTAMTSREYKKFLDKGFITKSGKILDAEGIRKSRVATKVVDIPHIEISQAAPSNVQVSVKLGEEYNQDTAVRLETLGFVVVAAEGNELVGQIDETRIEDLEADQDVSKVSLVAAG